MCVCVHARVCVRLCIFSVPGLSPEQLTAPAGHNASVDLGPELVTHSVYFYWDKVKDGQQKILCGINKHNGSANTPREEEDEEGTLYLNLLFFFFLFFLNLFFSSFFFFFCQMSASSSPRFIPGIFGLSFFTSKE